MSLYATIRRYMYTFFTKSVNCFKKKKVKPINLYKLYYHLIIKVGRTREDECQQLGGNESCSF